MTLQQLNAQKQALEQSLKEIDAQIAQIAELTHKEKRTVLEWLQWAKEQGYDWAQSAIDQCSIRKKESKSYSLDYAIINFTCWRDTKEGHEYWNGIFDELCA